MRCPSLANDVRALLPCFPCVVLCIEFRQSVDLPVETALSLSGTVCYRGCWCSLSRFGAASTAAGATLLCALRFALRVHRLGVKLLGVLLVLLLQLTA